MTKQNLASVLGGFSKGKTWLTQNVLGIEADATDIVPNTVGICLVHRGAYILLDSAGTNAPIREHEGIDLNDQIGFVERLATEDLIRYKYQCC